jgi:hypothetical protein
LFKLICFFVDSETLFDVQLDSFVAINNFWMESLGDRFIGLAESSCGDD